MSLGLEKELEKIIRGDVYTDEQTLERFSRDASMFEVRPSAVVTPKDVEDIKALVKYAAENPSVSLTPSAGRSDMSGGVLTESIILDFTRHFNRIKEIGDDYAVVEPGVYYRDFEKETLKRGLLLPSYPASKDLAAIGGMVANNSGGEKTLAYGKTEDYLRELKVVLSDGNEYAFRALGEEELNEKLELKTFEGEIYRKLHKLLSDHYQAVKLAKPKVTKNSAGYYLWNVWDKETGLFDLTKLFVGSQGTLGIITEVTFRLVRPKPHSKLLVIFLRDIGKLADIVKEIRRFNPESLESYDDKTLKLVASNIIKLAFKFLPEAKMVLTGGWPKLILMAEFTGESVGEVEERAKEAAKNLKKFRISTHLVKDGSEAQKYWRVRREAFNLLRSPSRKKRSVPFIDDLIVRPEKLPEFLPRLYNLLDSYKDKMTYAVGGHPGDGNLHIYSIVDINDRAVRAIIPEVMDKVYTLTIELGGSITAEHNDGLVRTPYLKKMYGENIIQLFEETKNIFDPKNIFNPGKKVGGDFDYVLKHIKTS